MSEAPKKRWYVVQAFSGFEGRVAQSLREHIKMHGMEEHFDEVLVPGETRWRIFEKQKREGIELDSKTINALSELAHDVGVTTPWQV